MIILDIRSLSHERERIVGIVSIAHKLSQGHPLLGKSLFKTGSSSGHMCEMKPPT